MHGTRPVCASVRYSGLLAVLVALGGCASPGELRPFKSDGCSLFPDKSNATGKDWSRCCVCHDLVYWAGGTAGERRKADLELKECVAGITHKESLANLMHAGVRIGGTPYLPTPFRWSYGWGYGRFYKPLSAVEQALVDPLKPNPPLDCPADETDRP